MPSFTPPNPGITGDFIAAVARCTFDATTNALRDAAGTQLFVVLARAAAGGAAVEWGVDTASSGCPRCPLSRQTFEILTTGTLQADGLILFRGTRYRVIAAGPTTICTAVAA